MKPFLFTLILVFCLNAAHCLVRLLHGRYPRTDTILRGEDLFVITAYALLIAWTVFHLHRL